MTCDDMHVWLAPVCTDHPNIIRVTFAKAYELGLIRIWNYNKSRIHASRGAREIVIWLDEALVFAGEICKAPGNLVDAPGAAECILFSEDEEMLMALDKFDEK